MKLTVLLSLATLALPAFSAPVQSKRQSGAPDTATITRLAPPLGFTAGRNPTGTGDCDGAVNGPNGAPIKIPCACPPAQDVYISQLIANVQAGKALNNPTVSVSFPTGDSQADKSARITAASITLQNLNGPGKGCPVVSTTFPLQQKAINAGTDVPAAPTPPATTPSNPANPQGNTSGDLNADTIKSLAPDLGFQSGVNPTGTGDCDGAVNGPDGRPIKVPCSCPPPQDVYLNALVKNVQAGIAVNNPTVKVDFPTDNSKQSQSARITAALITLQNLNGSGKGCPAASTTLLARQRALAA